MEELEMPIVQWKNSLRKGIYYIIPTTGRSGKGKTMQTVNRLVVATALDREGGGERWIGSTGDSSGQWKYCVWYRNDGYV